MLPFWYTFKGVLLTNQFGETSTDEPTAAAAVFDVRKKLVFAEGAPGETDLDAIIINDHKEIEHAPKPGITNTFVLFLCENWLNFNHSLVEIGVF